MFVDIVLRDSMKGFLVEEYWCRMSNSKQRILRESESRQGDCQMQVVMAGIGEAFGANYSVEVKKA
jgi:hypothetical protein